MKILAIATIPGDGIGKEVIPGRHAGAGRLAAADGGFGFDFEDFDWSGPLPSQGRDDADRWPRAAAARTRSCSDRGPPAVSHHMTLWGLGLKIWCFCSNVGENAATSG